MPARKIAKVLSRTRFGAPKSDFTYWQKQSPADRLAALEQIRREYHGQDYDQKMEKVIRIIRKKDTLPEGSRQDLADLENLGA